MERNNSSRWLFSAESNRRCSNGFLKQVSIVYVDSLRLSSSLIMDCTDWSAVPVPETKVYIDLVSWFTVWITAPAVIAIGMGSILGLLREYQQGRWSCMLSPGSIILEIQQSPLSLCCLGAWIMPTNKSIASNELRWINAASTKHCQWERGCQPYCSHTSGGEKHVTKNDENEGYSTNERDSGKHASLCLFRWLKQGILA